MLVLSRKPSERVVMRCECGCEASVTVVEVRGRKVRLGFDAPESLVVKREEISRMEENGGGE